VIEEKAIGVIMMCPAQTDNSGIRREQVKSAAELLSILINYIFKHEFDFLVVSESDKQFSRNQEAVLKAVAFIKKNYHDKDISLQKVSSEVALSHYYFSHIFKDELKITFIEYLTKIRMEAAAKMLKNRNLNVNQIAYAVGYQDPNYFSKVFKRYMKTSPIEYRNSVLKKGVEKQIITA
jgi:two-component system response regulator YesN